MNYDNKITGIVYPLSQTNIDRLLKQKNPVYIKFLTGEAKMVKTKLRQKDYLLFYITKKNKSIEYYSKIKQINFKLPSVLKKSDINRTQMDEKEFKIYIKGREEKPILFLELENISKMQSIKNVISMSMSGRYIYREELSNLLKNEK